MNDKVQRLQRLPHPLSTAESWKGLCDMEREEAIKILADLTDNLFLHTWEEQYKALHMAIEALRREEAEEKGYCHRIIPSNVEVVVRCKDCRHSDTTGVYVEDVVYCKWLHTSCVKNGYCHRGERKGGDTE